MKLLRAVTTLFFGAVLTASACTTFNGLSAEPSPGADGGANAPDGGSQEGYLGVDDAVALCTNVFACPLLPQSVLLSLAIPLDAAHFSACVSWASDPLPASHPGRASQASYLVCVAEAADCASAIACLSTEAIDPADPRCAGISPDSIGQCSADGNDQLLCTDYIIHCQNRFFAPGSTCQLDAQGYTYCGTGSGCTVSACSGQNLLSCVPDNGATMTQDCGALGRTCAVDGVGQDNCLTGNVVEMCTGDTGASVCTGNVIAVCDSQFVSRYDCGELGATCDSVKGAPRCALPSDSCSPYDKSGVDTCNGTSITMCVGGKSMSYDCGKLGKSCQPAAGSISAHCG
jgi:hypothetical protein